MPIKILSVQLKPEEARMALPEEEITIEDELNKLKTETVKSN
jgi:hypothetical protein